MRVFNSGRMTASSYAVLGLLAKRDYSAYELNKELRRSLAFVWPRKERGIYDEIKWLEQLGLADATVSYNGRQRRTVYSITREGRKAVSSWLDKPAERGIVLESEPHLRLYVTGADDAERLHAALEAIEADAVKIFLAISDEPYAKGETSEESLRWQAHLLDFLDRYARMLAGWSQQTRELIDAWATMDSEAVRAEAQQLIERTRLQAGQQLQLEPEPA